MAAAVMHKHVGDTPLTKQALAFAIERHAGQIRKVSGLPYIVHPMEVYAITRKYKESANIDALGAIALLHDILEDTPTTHEELLNRFGPLVADTVRELTNDEVAITALGKEKYIDEKLLELSSYALVVKLADMLANVGENPTEKTVQRIEHHCVFLLFSDRRLSETHRALISEIQYTIATLYGISQ
jgi:(p)ppGpp synthase/HD superfamily hydrolase